ncbi:hypothetical protein AJ87_39825 [Rhizobium yanglingense]|nr:hypothetical protein AJ87_39825 [Rhizobium yanglingense]
MSISPASTANYDWFLDKLCAGERTKGEAQGSSIHALLAPEIDAAFDRPSTALFHPYLFGSPYGASASAGFFGLGGWHDRGDMLRAVLEGIAFNHRIHVDALGDGFEFEEARLAGGVSRNPLVVQMFADVLGIPVTVTETDEAAAWGAALCAGSALAFMLIRRAIRATSPASRRRASRMRHAARTTTNATGSSARSPTL